MPSPCPAPWTLSLAATVTLTGKSRRTLWRRIADGTLPKAQDDTRGRTMLSGDKVRAEACLPLTDAQWLLVQAADNGVSLAQAELGGHFLASGQMAGARYWLEQAAAQGQADAMHWLSHLAFGGQDGEPDEAQGMVWLTRAAAAGHAIAQAQVAGLRPSADTMAT